MAYKNNQKIIQPNRHHGKEYTYIMQKMPRYMLPTERVIAGSVTQPALCHNLLKSGVMVRSPQYTRNERADGVEGLKRGRARFKRQIELLNRVQANTSACPEPLDLIYTHNRDDFPQDQEELARQEPRLITERFQGDSLDRFRSGDVKPQDALFNPANTYWFQSDKLLTDQSRFKRLSVRRVAQLTLRIATHCAALLESGVVHLDIKPEHVLILKKDEVPRLVGIGHLAPLDEQGMLSPADPVHAFTTAGFAAPELVSEVGWGQPQSGEAIMLYSLGATCLSLIHTGPQADLCSLWRAGGQGAIEELVNKMMSSSASSAHKRLYQAVSDLLTPDPKARLSKLSLNTLIELMEELRYGARSHISSNERTPAGPQEEMSCQHCHVSFMGHPKRSMFVYRGQAFPLCPEHHSAARERITYNASRCGHEVTELQGLVWARSWMSWHPRARCNDCRD